MSKILEKLFKGADNHGEDAGESDHTVGDLQDLLRAAWGILSASQKEELLKDDAVEAIVDLGARGEFDEKSLIAELHASVAEMQAKISAAGYKIKEVEDGFFWESATGASCPFPIRVDAVDDAFKDLEASA